MDECAYWMGNFLCLIGDRKLQEISIPGAHHAGFLTLPWWSAPAALYAKCQTKGITELLDNGVRYFDLRLGERDGVLYFSHTVLSEQSWDAGLVELNAWVRSHPSEIVILNIRKDSEYKLSNSDTAYRALPSQLLRTFGSMLISNAEFSSMTFNDLVGRNKRVALIGDTGLGTLPYISSWGETKSGNWGTVNSKVRDWVLGNGLEAIEGGRISIAAAAVSPGYDADFSPPRRVADQLNAGLSPILSRIPNYIGVVEMDFVSEDLVCATIAHNATL